MDSTLVFKLVILSIIVGSFADERRCPCQTDLQCNPINTWNGNEREVIIMTDHPTSYTEWMWESITTVVTHNISNTNKLMCYTHSMGKKFGFYTDKIPLDLSLTSIMKSFIDVMVTEIKEKWADMAVLDFIPYLARCDIKGESVPHMNTVVRTVVREIKNKTSALVLCSVPWKPPCYDNDCSVTAVLAEVCDAAILSPNSFSTSCEESCSARSTVSYNRLTLGLSEYISFGFQQDQLIVGVPWYGYNYTCQNDDPNFLSNYPLCRLKTDNGTCDYEGSRRKRPIGEYEIEHPELIYIDDFYSVADQAPWLTETYNIGVNQTAKYVTWFEDMGSLQSKYRLISDFSLKGCAVYFGEDLAYAKIATNNEFNSHMWSWLIHTTLVAGTPTSEKKMYNTAATVAGVGVGMFVFGCLLGVIIACIIFRRPKRLRAPFSHDPMTDEYHDDNEL